MTNQPPPNRSRTRAIRARMVATGESWTAAARHHDTDRAAPAFTDDDVARWRDVLDRAAAAAQAGDPGALLLGDPAYPFHLVVPAGDADRPFARWLTAEGLMGTTPDGPALLLICTRRQATAFAAYLAGSFTRVTVQDAPDPRPRA